LLFLLVVSIAAAQQPALTPEEKQQAAEANRLTQESVQNYQQGQFAKSVELIRQALTIRQQLYPKSKYPDGHPELALNLNNMGFVLKAQGAYEEALNLYRQSLAMSERLFPAAQHPQGHLLIARTLNNLASLHHDRGEFDVALAGYERGLAMYQKLFPESTNPNGHAEIATCLNNLGLLYKVQGTYDKALSFYEQALAQREKLFPTSKFPQGHPMVASSWNNLGALLTSANRFAAARPYLDRALDFYRKAYPESKFPAGHYDIAICLNNLALLDVAEGSYDRALGHYGESLAMRKKLFPPQTYPNGHPSITSVLGGIALLHQNRGDYVQALDYAQQTIAMSRQLFPKSRYPDGHPDLIRNLNNLGFLQIARGVPADAAQAFGEALEMRQKLFVRLFAAAPEAESLAMVRNHPVLLDGFLTSSTGNRVIDADAARFVWNGKAAITRALEQRWAAARLAGTESASSFTRLRDLRQMIDRTSTDPRLTPPDRERQVRKLTEETDQIERDLARVLPAIASRRKQESLGPADLANALPQDSVFVDFLEYYRFARDAQKSGRDAEIHSRHFVAFVIAPKKPAIRVELGDAKAIEAAVQSWRKSIDAVKDDRANAARLRELVWNRVAAQIPPGTRTVYISTDGDLARLPFAALPGTQPGSILLEEFAIAVVPHGPHLLESLMQSARPAAGDDRVVAVGNLRSNSTKWPPLPATKKEITAIQSHAGKRDVLSLTGGDATVARMRRELTNSRYVHIATHGYFAEAELQADRRRQSELNRSALLGSESQPPALHPLSYSGLVLSDGEVFSGFAIVDLKLDNVRLITLSACETGLGDGAKGEGVQGLQRAFHLAGCENIIASLWNVNDSATAALMAKFYHELWVNKQEPLAALRTAQLTIYRHPERIEILAGDRGKPDQLKTVELKPELDANTKRKQVTPTKLWAAFVLSGAGR
jgi:CHAT domain-containing protein/Tfp pilus assembly protein PilF